MVNCQAALVCDHRGPHVLTGQPLVDLPGFVEHTNQALRLDAPEEVEASGREWQVAGQRPDVGPGQSSPRRERLGGWRRVPVEGRRLRMLGIPSGELGTGPFDMGETAEAASFPERLTPQALEPLHHAVALGFVHGQEDGFTAQVQPEPDEVAGSSPPVPVTWVRQQTRHFGENGSQVVGLQSSLPVRPA